EPRRRFERACEEAERLQLFDGAALTDLCARSPGRRGVRLVKGVLPTVTLTETRSELERRFIDFCRDAGLPRPATNQWIEGHEVNALWPDRNLIVELDGYAFHHTRAAFERDRKRDTALQL